jgi:hypothetical protein
MSEKSILLSFGEAGSTRRVAKRLSRYSKIVSSYGNNDFHRSPHALHIRESLVDEPMQPLDPAYPSRSAAFSAGMG